MKKGTKIVIILLLLLVIVAGVIALIKIYGGNEPPVIEIPSGDVETRENLAEKVSIKDNVVKNKTDNRYIDCVYPILTSLKDKEFENSINTEIALNIQEYRNEIEYIIDEQTEATEMYRYVTFYDRYNSGNYLSLVIDQDYQTGGIRSNKWKDIYNINAKTERLFYLNELFEPGVDFQTAIIEEIEKQAEAKNYELMGGNGLTKLPTKQKFYIKDDVLVIYFDPSEAAATVFGELHFEMPFKMNEEGIFEIK